jgi:O-Antigen ligase
LLVTIVYLVSENIKERKTLHQIVAVFLISSAFAAVFSIGNFVVGRNLKVISLAENSPLKIAGVKNGDTIQKANGKSVSSPEELENILDEKEITKIKVYRYELFFDYDVPKIDHTLTYPSAADALGILEWSRGRDVRAAGFYGQYMTFSEALQLIASLSLGLFVVCLDRKYKSLLLLALIAFCGALFLTVTRASWLSFIISSSVIILFGTSRKTILICAALAIPLIIGGLIYLQQKRNVGFIDTKDNSTTWRFTVWREGVEKLVKNPRHLAVGIGMDSLKKHWQEWGMFDNGKLPNGHMHNDYLQFALERGVPTLLAWLIWIALYLKMLWRGLKENLGWIERGILLGALGGTIGFLTSGLTHYNWGDSEVVMIFYLIMGLTLAILRNPQTKEKIAHETH